VSAELRDDATLRAALAAYEALVPDDASSQLDPDSTILDAYATPEEVRRLLDERDAAIRRAEGLEAAAHAAIAAWDDKWIGCSEMREPIESLRAALRSQESQKPPETPLHVKFDVGNYGPSEPPETEDR